MTEWSDPSQQIRRYCRDADQAAFRDFYRSQAKRLWKFLIARGCNSEDAYDLVAEAFLRFIQSVCKDPRYPRALLYRIAVNLAIDSHRRRQTAPVDPVADPGALAPAAPAEPDEHAAVRTLVMALPEREQNLVLLRYWIGLSHRETARALGLPEGTVRRQCFDALQTLRKSWNRE